VTRPASPILCAISLCSSLVAAAPSLYALSFPFFLDTHVSFPRPPFCFPLSFVYISPSLTLFLPCLPLSFLLSFLSPFLILSCVPFRISWRTHYNTLQRRQTMAEQPSAALFTMSKTVQNTEMTRRTEEAWTAGRASSSAAFKMLDLC